MAQLIDGKKVSMDVKMKVREEVASLGAQGITPCLAVVILEGDAASRIYVNNKKKACELCGIVSKEYALANETTEEELLALIDRLNTDRQVHGILVQLPLPEQIDEQKVIARISPDKDVDSFHAINAGRLMTGNPAFLPCTPAGCMELIASTGVQISGKQAVVVGRSNIVGKPMAMLLLAESATVTICHSRTQNLAELCRTADILVAAVGVPNLITGDMVKPGAVVIDVGMNRDGNGKLCGDVDFPSASDTAGYLTPVPGGVGPMTIAMLMKNTLEAAKQQSADSYQR